MMEKTNWVSEQRRSFQLSGKASNVPWRLLAVLSLINLGLIALAVFQPFSSLVYTYIYGILAVFYPLILAFICMKDSRRLIASFKTVAPALRPGRRFSALLLGINILVFTATQTTSLLYFLITHTEAPFPSLPYFLLTGIYPLFISAILLLPAREISLLARLRILLDSLIIIVLAATLCYYFVLTPILSLQGDENTAEKIVGTFFPSADVVVMFCLLLIALRSGEQALRPVLIQLMLAFFMIFAIHVNRLYEVINDTFSWIERVSVAWAPAMMLIVGAAQTIKNILKKEGDAGSIVARSEGPADTLFSTGRWKSWLSLIVVLAVSLLIILLWLAGIKKIFQGQIAIISVGGFIVLMLVVLRQLLAVYEIGVLQRKLQRRNRSLNLLNDILEEQATTDSLTGLPNHRELMVRLDEALVAAQEATAICAVIFIDLDHFKDINDRYGHLVGDAVLCEVSELIVSAIRVDDCLGRWGGEEFVAILPGVEPAEAFQMAERIRVLIEQHAFVDEQEVRLTCSQGTATYPYVATRREDLLARADSAMYTAKRLGRNQTRMALEPLVLAVGMLGEAPETVEETEMLAVVESFIAALEVRDHPTGQHSRRVATLSLRLALELGITWQDACIVGMGGLLHDLGKVAMPDAILFKHGKLSASEIEYMARHPLIGEEILAFLPALRGVAAIVRAHHEWVNGTGYPDGLQGDSIPLGARIVAVSDAYDAIISHRIYRQGRAPSEATKELHKAAGKQFDPSVVEALDHLLATTPQASLVGAV